MNIVRGHWIGGQGSGCNRHVTTQIVQCDLIKGGGTVGSVSVPLAVVHRRCGRVQLNIGMVSLMVVVVVGVIERLVLQ